MPFFPDSLMLLVLDIDVTAVYCRCFCSLGGKKIWVSDMS